jgi:hypothetical protein
MIRLALFVVQHVRRRTAGKKGTFHGYSSFFTAFILPARRPFANFGIFRVDPFRWN